MIVSGQGIEVGDGGAFGSGGAPLFNSSNVSNITYINAAAGGGGLRSNMPPTTIGGIAMIRAANWGI